MKKILTLTIITWMALFLAPQTTKAVAFEGFYYDPSTISDFCHTARIEFGLTDYNPNTDIVTISVFNGKTTDDLKTKFHEFENLEGSTGKPNEGWGNFFTIHNLTPGAYYTLVAEYNGKKYFHTFKMLGTNTIKDAPADFVKVYPNPNKGIFFVEAPSGSIISIYNSIGEKVLGAENLFSGKEISEYLPNGMYFVTVQTNGDLSSTTRVFIQR